MYWLPIAKCKPRETLRPVYPPRVRRPSGPSVTRGGSRHDRTTPFAGPSVRGFGRIDRSRVTQTANCPGRTHNRVDSRHEARIIETWRYHHRSPRSAS